MAGCIHGAAHFANARCGAGAGFIMHHGNGLDDMGLVFAETGFDGFHIGATAPIGFHEIRHDPKPGRHFIPQMGEPASFAHQHAVPWGKRIGKRGFPGAGAAGGVDHHRALGLEDMARLFQQSLAEDAKIRAAMVHGGVVHRAQNAVRHIAWPRNLQEMAPGNGL